MTDAADGGLLALLVQRLRVASQHTPAKRRSKGMSDAFRLARSLSRAASRPAFFIIFRKRRMPTLQPLRDNLDGVNIARRIRALAGAGLPRKAPRQSFQQGGRA